MLLAHSLPSLIQVVIFSVATPFRITTIAPLHPILLPFPALFFLLAFLLTGYEFHLFTLFNTYLPLLELNLQKAEKLIHTSTAYNLVVDEQAFVKWYRILARYRHLSKSRLPSPRQYPQLVPITDLPHAKC